MKKILIGVSFAALWGSASIAGKIGLRSVQPLLLFDIRFFIAAPLMLFYAYIFQTNKLPTRQEFGRLTIFGFLNTTVYLGCFIIAMREISAGIGTLLIALNPLMISLLSSFWLKRRVKLQEWIGIFLGIFGVAIATYPLLLSSHATFRGLFIVLIGLLGYSIGTIYYASFKWNLSTVAINGWQVLMGGVLMLPLTLLMTDWNANTYDIHFWTALLWLIGPVSIGAVLLWLKLLSYDTVSASMWLLLCPISGFVGSFIFLGEPITIFTVVGTAFVMLGLYLGQKGRDV